MLTDVLLLLAAFVAVAFGVAWLIWGLPRQIRTAHERRRRPHRLDD